MFSFNFSVVDVFDNNLTCNLTVDSGADLLNFGALNGTWTNQTVSGITDGFHSWFVNCSDDAGNSGGSSVFNFTRMTVPDISLIWPNDGYWFNSGFFNLTSYLSHFKIMKKPR